MAQGGDGRGRGRPRGPQGFERAEGALGKGAGRVKGFVRSLGLGDGEGTPGKGALGLSRAQEGFRGVRGDS